MTPIRDIIRRNVCYRRRSAGSLYHGGPIGFEKFNPPPMDKSRAWGLGIWLSDSFHVAKGFGERVATLKPVPGYSVMTVAHDDVRLSVFETFSDFMQLGSLGEWGDVHDGLLAEKMDGLVILASETDGMPARGDFCMLDPARLQVIESKFFAL